MRKALSRAKQTAPFAFESLSQYFDVKHQSVQVNQTKCTCIALTILCRSHLLSHYDWSITQCLHVIGKTTFIALPSASIITGKQPGYIRHYRNPGQNVSSKNCTSGHPILHANIAEIIQHSHCLYLMCIRFLQMTLDYKSGF